ncbi:MAG: MAC/perforin domain-containing protein, partial [Gammaproteobacteria bacterium]
EVTNPNAAPTFYVSAGALSPMFGQGINIITATPYPSIFSSFPKLIGNGDTSTSSVSSVTTIASSSDYQSSCSAEASIGGSYKLCSVSASTALTSSLSLSTQSLGVVAYGSIAGQTFAPLNLDFSKAVISSAIDLSSFTSYSEFVDKYGSHFIGGYITGASYSAAYQMDCSSYSDTETLSASLKASSSDIAFSANFSASVEKAVTSSGAKCTTSWHQNDIGWPDSAPSLEPANDTGIDDNIAHFLAFISTQLTKPVAYICFDWRMIPAIQKCAWAQNPDIDMQEVQLNQPTVAGAYEQLQYAQTSASTSITNVYYVGDSAKTSLNSISQTATNDLTYINSLSVNDVANLNVTNFNNDYNVGGELTAQVQLSNQGYAMIYCYFTADGAFTPLGPESYTTPQPVKPTGAFTHVWTTTKTDGETWWWGYIYNENLTLEAKFGSVDSKGNFKSGWTFTSTAISYEPGTANSTEAVCKNYPWLTATAKFV